MNLKTTLHRKYTKGLILFLLFSWILTGCLGKEDYKAYKDAAVKTDAIQKGAQSVKVAVNQTLFEEAEPQNVTTLKGLETLKFDLSGQFDYEKNLALYDIYYYYNDLGNDIKYIQKSETEQYIKIPMFKDYLKLNAQSFASEGSNETTPVKGEFGSADIFKTIIDEIGIEWNTMIQKENIFVGEKTTIKNEDGDVKATKFTIKPTTEQLELISDRIKTSLLAHTDELANAFNQFSRNGMSTNGGAIANNDSKKMKMDAEEIHALIENLMSNMTITHYEEVAYVDLDGYIIEETTTIGIDYTQTDQFTPLFKAQEIVINSKFWGIEKTQKFDFPEIDESNSKSMDAFDFSGDLAE
ncbi:hypothetical protein [Fusibacter sp. 3D3]|uniref:hypothetical protein n=1 Tax=Fusibacter sp. 3D3 TaxID=1048380 RepID=UPI0008530001|nr:hypothetical protein [Fusibacter sp. 3D3]GAU76283.1 hypothetical protein F3D3_0880 [Fusibacter sp. 3D3]